MGKWKRARLILVLWAAAVLCLAVYAVVAKRMRQDWIAGAAVAALTADAESGTMEGSDYLWSANGYGWQGPMVDLIERGRHYPEMERVMLLMEARRVYDWIYLYPRYRNADLRAGLMEHCLAHYKADPLVHWAAGRLHLVAGDYAEAADEFDKAVKLGFNPALANVPEEHFEGRRQAALLLAGRLSEAEELLGGDSLMSGVDSEVAYRMADLYCTLGQYDMALRTIRSLDSLRGDNPRDERDWQLLLRTYFWSGDIEAYTQAATFYVERQPGASADRVRAMLALLEFDFSGAVDYSGERAGEQDWWLEWYQSWDYYRLLANAYAATGEQAYLVELDDWRDYVRQEKAGIDERVDATWEERDRARNLAGELIAIAGQRARVHALRGEWEAAAAALAEADPESSYRKDSSYQAIAALVAISQGEALEEHSLADLAATGAVEQLLLSPQLDSAARASGRTWDEARQALLLAIRPEHSDYWQWQEDHQLSW